MIVHDRTRLIGRLTYSINPSSNVRVFLFWTRIFFVTVFVYLGVADFFIIWPFYKRNADESE